MLETDESLYAARQADTYVRSAFYADNGSFLLRFYIQGEDDFGARPGMWGTFDVSGTTSLVAWLLESALPQLKPKLRVDNAKAFFDASYAG